MNKRKKLTQGQTDELLTAMKMARIKREYRRIQAIYLYSLGKEVAEITQLTPVTISRLYTKYRSEGLTSIPDALRKGRPHRLTEKQEAMIKDLVLNKTLADVGFLADFNWTARMVAEYILKELNVR